jgi:hypothetical protein
MTISITWFGRLASDAIANDIKTGGWQAMTSGTAGDRLKAAEYSDRTVQTYGTYSGGATISMRGSCMANPNPDTATDWFVLHAAHDGSALSGLAATAGAVLLENPLWLSPLVTGGDGSTSINYDITLKKGT